MTFFGMYVVLVNSFDIGLIGSISLAVQIVIFFLFNVFRLLKEWKVTLFVYFLPTITAFYAYLEGSHMLYEWTPVS